MSTPVITMQMADDIERESLRILRPLYEGGPIPRAVILTIAIITLKTYTGLPVELSIEDSEKKGLE